MSNTKNVSNSIASLNENNIDLKEANKEDFLYQNSPF